MTTTNFRSAWTMALSMLSACALPPDLLEAGSQGDGDSESSTDGDTSPADGEWNGEGTSDTGEVEFEGPECVVQGTNIEGEPEPQYWFLPEPELCEVVCATGWGHDVPLLESEWTELTDWVDPVEGYTRGSLGISPDGRVIVVFSGVGANYTQHTATPEGEYGAFFEASFIRGEILDFGIDADQEYYYYVWTDGETQELFTSHENGYEYFRRDLGPHGLDSRLAVVDDGVIILLNVDGDTRLLRIDQSNDIVFDQPIPTTTRIDVSPSGNVIALANAMEVSWADMQGNYLGGQPIEVMWMHELLALDDTHVLLAGSESDGNGRHRGALREVGTMGLDWAQSYDRADSWCVEAEGPPTQEQLLGVERLADGTLIAIGVESLGYPYSELIDHMSQPWVAHVSADGEQVLAYDRGFWQGRAIDVVTRGNAAYVLLTEDGSTDYFGVPYLRKYAF